LTEHVRSNVQLDQNKRSKMYAKLKIKDWTKSCDFPKWNDYNHKKNRRIGIPYD